VLGAKKKTPPTFREGYELPDFLRDDAFALNRQIVASAHSQEQTAERRKEKRQAFRVKCLVLGALTLVAVVFSLCLNFTSVSSLARTIYDPLSALSSLWNWAAYELGTVFGFSVFPAGTSLLDVAPLYASVAPRAGITIATLVCGAMLACAGMLYQAVFRNPIVSPSLLGVTHGSQVGMLLIFGGYGAIAYELVPERFLYGYVGGAVALGAVFLLSKLITKKGNSTSVFDILVIGTILSAFLGAVRDYLIDVLNAVDLWTEFFEYQEGISIYSDPLTYIVLIVSVIVAFIPVVILRFRLNLLTFSDGEVRVMGSNPVALRALSIVAGSLMILTAQVFVGSASCFALVIPFLARYLFGSEFRQQLWGNVLLGMLILTICRILTSLIPFVGIGLPIGTIAGALTLPFFVWASTLSRKGW
jgi:iron complex transport system permease protein